MKIKSLKDLLGHTIQDLYSAESQIIENLPKMAEKAQNSELKDAFKKHLEESKTQRDRLKKVADQMGVKADGEKCLAMEGLIKEADHMMKENDFDGEVRDAALIALAQKIEHYEIATYGTAITWCEQIGESDCGQQLEQSLDEEKKTDELLTQIASSKVNQAAE